MKSLFQRTDIPNAEAALGYAGDAGTRSWRDPEKQDLLRLAEVHATLALKDAVEELILELRLGREQ